MRSLVITGIILSLACSAKKDMTKVDADSHATSAKQKSDSLFLTFERSMCYGECPAFKVIVYSDGNASYEGIKFTDRIGAYETKMSSDKMKEVLEEAGRIGYFGMKDKYDNPAVTDVPSCTIMVVGPMGRKNVLDRFDAPDVLKAFEKYLDTVLLGLDWKKVD